MKKNTGAEFVLELARDTGLLGACLAGHAISDAVILMCGTVGCKAKLTRPIAFHDRKGDFAARFAWSEFTEHEVVTGDLERLRRAVLGQWERSHPSLILVVLTPLMRIVGLEIVPYILALRDTTGIPVYVVDAKETAGTVMQGYTAVMRTVLSLFERNDEIKNMHSVSIWGYPFDRYEGDHLGTVAVLKELLLCIGVRTDAVFFSGTSMKELCNASKSSTHLLLPLVHDMKGSVEKATGRPAVPVGYPVGVESTRRWLYSVALAVHKNKDMARMLVERARITGKGVASKRCSYANVLAIVDAHWSSYIAELAREFGCKKVTIAVRDRSVAGSGLKKNGCVSVVRVKGVQDMQALAGAQKYDLVIASARELPFFKNNKSVKVVCFGFPQYVTHYEGKFPYFGLNALNFFKK